MPCGPPVRLFWLVPLLKPELDYFQQRKYSNLARRFPSHAPWADRNRKPLADPLNWFQEDIAPFVWSEERGLCCLGLDVGDWHEDLFLQAAVEHTAWGWERLARKFLDWYLPDGKGAVDFACEDGVFFAASRDEEIMRKLALGLSDLLRDHPDEAVRLLR